MKDPKAYMPLYVADYLVDTAHLTLEQSGAYLHLLMTMWRQGGDLPAGPGPLSRILGVSETDFARLWKAIGEFFPEKDGRITNPRLTLELEKARRLKEKRVKRAKKAAEARWAKEDEDNNGGDDAPGNATSNATSTGQAMLEECPSPSPSESESKASSPSPAEVGGARARAFARACGLFGTDPDYEWLARLAGEDRFAHVDIGYELVAFCDWWGNPPKGRKRRNVKNAIRNWMRRAVDDYDAPGRQAARDAEHGRSPAPPDVEVPDPDPEAEAVWGPVLRELKARMDPHAFSTWIRPIIPVGIESGRLRIWLPTNVAADWVGENHRETIEEATGDLGLEVESVEIIAPERAA